MTAEYVKELTHSRKTAAGKYVCRYCDKAYDHPGPINFHVAQVHPEKLKEKDPPTAPKGPGGQKLPDESCRHTWKSDPLDIWLLVKQCCDNLYWHMPFHDVTVQLYCMTAP